MGGCPTSQREEEPPPPPPTVEPATWGSQPGNQTATATSTMGSTQLALQLEPPIDNSRLRKIQLAPMSVPQDEAHSAMSKPASAGSKKPGPFADLKEPHLKYLYQTSLLVLEGGRGSRAINALWHAFSGEAVPCLPEAPEDEEVLLKARSGALSILEELARESRTTYKPHVAALRGKPHGNGIPAEYVGIGLLYDTACMPVRRQYVK